MGNARAMLARVRRLERGRVSAVHRLLGCPQAFHAHVQAGMAAGTYDKRDMPIVASTIERWLHDGL
ncbi:phage-related hypothetical protein [Bordetella bronchiseptica RB50]|uniref:Uncharacterized protein n=1 Tax=Bordetella bronchiseptica (strain ATCC BAA-588 / NCTC 13252 / RB50) TaxID=257310 RepID=A0A0H3LWF3_BORBR|nr:hypothetical protein AL472_22240 [Bordetella bronchiseptica]KCV27475.1 hypothetical protein L489_4557 [Bordetella bronchiseptica 00-P-2730]CAE34510.1 phage-related hypothetical protein [Bordetella bronchiseptica RB50]